MGACHPPRAARSRSWRASAPTWSCSSETSAITRTTFPSSRPGPARQEHDAGIDRATAERAYGQAGVELLYNSAGRASVRGATLTVVGLDDPVLGHPDLGAGLATVRAGDPTLWVVHAPGWVEEVPRDVAPQPSAILAGHTHGGQVRLPFWTPYTPRGSGRFVAGWYRDTIRPLYVSRGIGTITLRARLFCPPELPIFTLIPPV